MVMAVPASGAKGTSVDGVRDTRVICERKKWAEEARLQRADRILERHRRRSIRDRLTARADRPGD